MTELFFPGTEEINDWLGYGQADSDIWQAERLGYVESAAGNYAAAIKQFEMVLKEYPDNGRIKGKIDWIKPIAETRSFSLNLTPDMMQEIVGSYGDRRLFLSDGVLTYQRGNGTAHALIPLFDTVFQVGDLIDFRLEVVINSDGMAEKLVGRYEGGWSDESIRTSD